jgi:membrane protease YdiL (CAAX protease family)
MSVFAGLLLHALDPDVPLLQSLQGVRGLIASALASSGALIFTVSMATRGLSLARLRLVPGRESGADIVVAILGVLSLGQALDSLTTLVRLADQGSMSVIRKALYGVSGQELFLCVVTLGIVAGAAEEIFFRGYMQSMLAERWRPTHAVLVTALCFGALHLDVVHGPLAAVLGLYLGFVTERTGSALPAIVCHIVNNTVYTVLTATVGSFGGAGLNAGLGVAGLVLFLGSVAWLRRSPISPPD